MQTIQRFLLLRNFCRVTTRATARAGLAAATLATSFGSAALARDLSVATRAGPFTEPLQTVFLAPFTAATGVVVDALNWPGGLAAIAAQAGAETRWDVVLVTADVLRAGCERGLLQKLDWNAVGGKDRYLPVAVSECGLGAYLQSTVLSWDRGKLQGTPSWADFWDVAKYPGKRGLKADVVGNLEIALMADGLAPGEVYAALRTEDGVRRAFRKLDQLRPYLVWWQDDAQSVELLGSGEVLMTSAPNEQVVAADRDGQRSFAIQWAGSLFVVDSWAIVLGSPNLAEANRFLAFYGDPVRQGQLAVQTGYGGTAKGANDKVPPAEQALSPSLPANLHDALALDPGFWRDNLAKLKPRFEAWLKK